MAAIFKISNNNLEIDDFVKSIWVAIEEEAVLLWSNFKNNISDGLNISSPNDIVRKLFSKTYSIWNLIKIRFKNYYASWLN